MQNKLNGLEFSENTKISGQELLFDRSKVILKKITCSDIPEKFYEDGYTIIDNVKNKEEAEKLMENFISNINERKLPLYAEFMNKIQLAKVDLIPVCKDILPRSFQALHFDMGQPIISESNQTMYILLALYKPKNSKPSLAKTRVVSIKKLLSRKKFGDEKMIEKKLINYAKNHGDGWKKPCRVNTFRLACFARVLDAITGENKLAEEIDYTTGQWFNQNNKQDGLENEKRFFSAYGLNLKSAEEQINVKPGQLLIVDNMRCVHGRVGPRNPKEIYQFLFGVKSVSSTTINSFRKWLASQFS